MRSGYFNSELIGYDAENMPVFDRAEEASFFAKYFSQFISNGIFPNPSTNMQVLVTEEMKVKVDIGVCYINGYMGWVETAEIFEIEESDIQSRIDRIVARLDFTDRSIKLFVKKGEALGNPVPPELQRDYDIYEIGLADILIEANTIEITQEKITDLRLNTEVCGIVANQLQHVDTTTIFNQYMDWLKRVMREGELNLQKAQQSFEQEFNNWFQTIQNVLDGDTAGHLFNLINTKAEPPRSKRITLLSSDWVENGETGYFEYVIPDENITKNHLINGYGDLDTKLTDGHTDSYNGGYKIITSELPEEDVILDITIEDTVREGGTA